MTNGVLLLIDMLGVKARWHTGGRRSAKKAFDRFESIMVESLSSSDERPTAGLIETDSCVLVFPTLRAALAVARHAYLCTFLASRAPKDERLWFRGVAVPYHGTLSFRNQKSLSQRNERVVVSHLDSALFDAIAAEKSGFRGMRILVGGGNGVGTNAKRAASRVEIKAKHYAPFLRVRTPPYPKQLAKGRFYDYMWMASESVDETENLKRAMGNRIKWSASNPEEFLHAAATQVIFNHWNAFVHSVPDEPW